MKNTKSENVNAKDEFIKISAEEWYNKYALEVELKNEDDFLIVMETLTRIGIMNYKAKKLYQSCHIFHKRDKYYICHFKELFALDGKPVNFSDSDIKRRNSIAVLLEDWGLIDIIDYDKIEDRDNSGIRVIKNSEKDKFELISKYTIGGK